MQKTEAGAVSARAGTPARFRSKVEVGLLALFLGWMGAHWWYLGRRRAWLVTLASCLLLVLAQFFDVWWENPAFFLLLIPAADGYIEAAVLNLLGDEKFDARYNPGQERRSRSGWSEVLVASFSLLIGTIVILSGIAAVVLYVFQRMGWLDGYVL